MFIVAPVGDAIRVEMSAKVLIVEDEMLVAFNMEAILEELGYEPIGIAPDAEAASKLAQAKPDLALVDINLRDGSSGRFIGEKLAREGVAVVFVTANPREAPSGCGAIGVLSKPCDEETIAEGVRYALARRAGQSLPPPPAMSVFA